LGQRGAHLACWDYLYQRCADDKARFKEPVSWLPAGSFRICVPVTAAQEKFKDPFGNFFDGLVDAGYPDGRGYRCVVVACDWYEASALHEGS